MKFTRNDFQQKLLEAIPTMANLLENGYSVTVANSRSGIKLTKIKASHVCLPPNAAKEACENE